MRAAVKLQFSRFPPLRAEEDWKIDFTAYERGGKAATASLPPLKAEESRKLQLIPPMRAAAAAGFPPLRAVENRKTQLYRR